MGTRFDVNVNGARDQLELVWNGHVPAQENVQSIYLGKRVLVLRIVQWTLTRHALYLGATSSLIPDWLIVLYNKYKLLFFFPKQSVCCYKRPLNWWGFSHLI